MPGRCEILRQTGALLCRGPRPTGPFPAGHSKSRCWQDDRATPRAITASQVQCKTLVPLTLPLSWVGGGVRLVTARSHAREGCSLATLPAPLSAAALLEPLALLSRGSLGSTGSFDPSGSAGPQGRSEGKRVKLWASSDRAGLRRVLAAGLHLLPGILGVW